MQRNHFSVLLTWVLLLACIVAAFLVLLPMSGLHIVRSEDYAMLERYAKMEVMRRALMENHYQELEDDVLMTGALKGMMAATGDEYSIYYTPEEMAAHNNSLNGVYCGMGILLYVGLDGQIVVLQVYENTPAEAAGVKEGDILLSVDGVAVGGGTTEQFKDAVNRLKGEDGTQAELRILRGESEVQCMVTRGEVSLSNVFHSMLDDNIGYIAISQFSGDDVVAFSTALNELQDAGACGLIIDLRGNPGGLITDVVSIADEILPAGLIVYTEERSGERKEYFAEGDYCDLPLAVLVDGMSASASEILAAAVQDYDRGVVIGTQTYGKGIVQSMMEFTGDGSGMQYTFAAYYTPGGVCIHETGVTPDIIVEAGDGGASLSGQPDAQYDPQLGAAMEYLRSETGE